MADALVRIQDTDEGWVDDALRMAGTDGQRGRRP